MRCNILYSLFFFSATDWLTLNSVPYGFSCVVPVSIPVPVPVSCLLSPVHAATVLTGRDAVVASVCLFGWLPAALLVHLIELINGTFHIHHLPGCIFFISFLSRFVFVLTYPLPTPPTTATGSYTDCNCIAWSCVFFAARVSFIYVSHFPHSIFFFLFCHESTNCKIQLKTVECKLISALGYANYAANESPSSTHTSTHIYTDNCIYINSIWCGACEFACCVCVCVWGQPNYCCLISCARVDFCVAAIMPCAPKWFITRSIWRGCNPVGFQLRYCLFIYNK